MWIAATTGLYLLDTLRGITARYSNRDKGINYLPGQQFTFIHPDSQHPDVYWLATRGEGLIRWNCRQGRFTQFTRQQGLSDNTIYAIYEDRFHRMWLPSNYGLMSFHSNTHQIHIFHTKDGIADEEFNLLAHYRSPDGRLFLGGINGITAFWPDKLQPVKAELAPLKVTLFKKLNMQSGQMTDLTAEFLKQERIVLSPSDRLFQLSFSSLDYRNIGKLRL